MIVDCLLIQEWTAFFRCWFFLEHTLVLSSPDALLYQSRDFEIVMRHGCGRLHSVGRLAPVCLVQDRKPFHRRFSFVRSKVFSRRPVHSVLCLTVPFLLLLQSSVAIDPVSEGGVHSSTSPDGLSSTLLSFVAIGWLLLASWLSTKLFGSSSALGRFGRLPFIVARGLWNGSWHGLLVFSWLLLGRNFITFGSALPWSLFRPGVLASLGFLADWFSTVGTFSSLLWLGFKAHDFLELIFALMDEYHQPLPPFRRHHTHCPFWFVRFKYGSMPRRPSGVISCLRTSSPDELDDWADEFLAQDLR